MHQQSFQVPRFGHNHVWTDHTGTRFSKHCKRTSISARMERRQSHAMDQSPFRVFSSAPTMVRRQLKRTRYRRNYCRLDQLSDTLGTGAIREDLNVAQRSRGFFGPRRSASGRDQGPRVKRSSIQQLKLRTRCARCRRLGHWVSVPKGIGDNATTKYDRRAVRPEENSKGVHHCSRAYGTKTFLSRRFLDIRDSRP